MKFSEVIKLELDYLIEWTVSVLEDKSKISKDFNLHGLAYLLGSEAIRNKHISKKIKLAELSVEVYEWLAEIHSKNDPSTFLNNANNLRIRFLAEHYVESSHPLLGTNKIAEWLWKDIDFTPSEAVKMTIELWEVIKEPRNVNPKQLKTIQTLRKMKNRLNLVRHLPTDNELLRDGKLNEWINIRKKLF